MSIELITPKQLAAKFECSEKTIYKMAKARKIPYVRLFSDMRFKVKDIEKLLEQKTIKTA
ncbi:MAG: Helix-turn-helix domain [Chitinophagaceae bacterium]|nr:Helix-turn-helix domain [Chitinophagaceae bacterium]